MKWIVTTAKMHPSGELEVLSVDMEASRLRCEDGALIFEDWRHTPVPGRPGVFFEDSGFYSVVRAFPPKGWLGVREVA